MDTSEPQARRRGFFLHSETTGEPDTGEHENPEGIIVRARLGRSSLPRQVASVSASGVRAFLKGPQFPAAGLTATSAATTHGPKSDQGA